MQELTQSIALLKKAGLRITPARKALLTTLAHSKGAMTLQSIAGHTDVDQATVYRNIEPLLQAGVLEAIKVNPKETRYALTHHHHDHAVCSGCGLIEAVQCAAPSAPRTTSFAHIDHHEVTYYGLCTTCAHSSS